MRFGNLPTTRINNIHTSPINQWKLYKNYMTLMRCLKVLFQLHLILSTNTNRNNLALRKKLQCTEYLKDTFCGGNNKINLIKYTDKILIPHNLQK